MIQEKKPVATSSAKHSLAWSKNIFNFLPSTIDILTFWWYNQSVVEECMLCSSLSLPTDRNTTVGEWSYNSCYHGTQSKSSGNECKPSRTFCTRPTWWRAVRKPWGWLISPKHTYISLSVGVYKWLRGWWNTILDKFLVMYMRGRLSLFLLHVRPRGNFV